MKWKLAAITCLALVIAGVVWFRAAHSKPPVTMTLRFQVTPAQQTDFVMKQANGARFKYLLGKRAGLTPALAQRLLVKPDMNKSLLEARLGAQTKADAQRYADAFVEVLQAECGNQAQVTLSSQTIH